ncbi:MAG: tRNA lysidine(34) synthetase TilS [Candidatus Neomarinimicrobiota bacterium]
MYYSKPLNFGSFQRHFLPFGIVGKNSRVVVAVSGGKDSITLLHLLKNWRNLYNIFIHAGHVNFHLRDQADNDQQLIENICRKWKIPLDITQAHPQKRRRNESIEMWARRIRYKALERIKNENECSWIFTAHHGNDQIETILMHLDQSCGIEGLRAIKVKRGCLVRPMLPFTKKSIQAYINNNKLHFAEDITNTDISIKRNFVRHEIVKPWEKAAPDIVNRFRIISEQAESALILEKKAFELLRKSSVKEENGLITIMVKNLNGLTPHLFSRFIKYLCIQNDSPWRRHIWKRLNDFIVNSKTGKYISLGGRWMLLKDRNKWLLGKPEAHKIDISLKENQSYDIFGRKFFFRQIPKSINKTDAWVEVIDKDRVKAGSLTLRTWQAGDEFQPLGMSGHKKVSDFLIDEKVDIFSKSKQLVLTAGEEIIWLCGQRLSDRVKISRHTSNYLELSFRPGIS